MNLISVFLLFCGSVMPPQTLEDREQAWRRFEVEALLLVHRSVLDELELSDTQLKEMKGVYEAARMELYVKRRVGLAHAKNPDDKNKCYDEGDAIIAAAREKFHETSLKFQQQRLSEIANQCLYFNFKGLDVEGIRKKLELSSSERKSLEKISQNYQAELKDLENKYAADVAKLMEKRMVDMKKKIDPSHRVPFQSFFGKPFPAVVLRKMNFK